MKNQTSIAAILKAEMVKYCEQIGIVKVPDIVFSAKEFNKIKPPRQYEKHQTDYLGIYSRELNLVCVNIALNKRFVWRCIKWPHGRKLLKRTPWGLRVAREVLVHELVHARWKSFDEGRRQWLRVKEIMKGKRFPPEAT